jgi:hypothetical protein
VITSLAVVLAMVYDLIAVLFRSRAAVLAENLFLRRQLVLCLERKTRRRRPTPATKFAFVILRRFFPWAVLAIVRPDGVRPERSSAGAGRDFVSSGAGSLVIPAVLRYPRIFAYSSW